jgi:hypothetical protein
LYFTIKRHLRNYLSYILVLTQVSGKARISQGLNVLRGCKGVEVDSRHLWNKILNSRMISRKENRFGE